MTQIAQRPAGFLSFTLHAHLPYVVNHGTWPHGMEWLHEAAVETYLPLLRALTSMERDGIALHCNLVVTPVLLEQLAHPVFLADFPKYAGRKILAAREDEAFFVTTGEHHYAELARFWQRFFQQALEDFNAIRGDIIGRLRHFNDTGAIDILTSAATHGYLPLLGTDESIHAQLSLAVETHTRHLGRPPRGLWSPECGYRPAGYWNYPVADEGATEPAPGFERIGLEQAFSEAGLGYFYVDTRLIEESRRTPLPQTVNGASASFGNPARILYQSYLVDGDTPSVAVFPRDPRTAFQVWSSELGYPGDPEYLDFHKKRWPGGHRYWRVTNHNAGLQNKQPYYEAAALARVRAHAEHFVSLVADTLKPAADADVPPILSAPFDAELFGHWWFEGVHWLEAVARELHQHPSGIVLTSSAAYLEQYPPAGLAAMPEGSWGTEGRNGVWLNPETSWTWTRIYPAERFVRELASGADWQESPLAKRILQQLCRELLLLESSDWQLLITTGAARDYAELRVHTHNDQFNELKAMWSVLIATGSLSGDQERRLSEISTRDSIFAEVDPGLWATKTPK